MLWRHVCGWSSKPISEHQSHSISCIFVASGQQHIFPTTETTRRNQVLRHNLIPFYIFSLDLYPLLFSHEDHCVLLRVTHITHLTVWSHKTHPPCLHSKGSLQLQSGFRGIFLQDRVLIWLGNVLEIPILSWLRISIRVVSSPALTWRMPWLGYVTFQLEGFRFQR